MNSVRETLDGLSSEERLRLRELLKARQPTAPHTPKAIQKPGPARSIEQNPASFAQQRLWFLEQLSPGTPVNHMAGAVRFRGAHDVEALTQCFAHLVARHEVLRTVFETVRGKLVPRVLPELTLPAPCVDLRGLPPAERESEAHRLMSAEARRPFDLAAGPLLRTLFLRLADRELLVLLVLHHTVGDGYSTRVIFGECMEVLRARAMGRAPSLPALPFQYGDYARWQRERVDAGELATQLDYWRTTLAGSDLLLELPTDVPRPPAVGHRGERAPLHLGAELTSALQSQARAHGVTLFMLLTAAYAVLLSRYTGSQDINVGTAVSGRGTPELERLIGCFLNMVVLRLDLRGNPSIAELLAATREVLLGAYRNQEFPFERLVDELAPVRDAAHTPLYQVAISLEDHPARHLRLGGLEVEFEELDLGTARADLLLDLTLHGQELVGALEYRAELFHRPTVDRMGRHLTRVLEAFAGDPARRVRDLDLFTSEEREQVLVDWNATQEPLPPNLCIHELVKDTATRYAAQSALRDEQRTVTYAELEVEASALARRLVAAGVSRHDRVGIAVQRSADMVVSLLGVLKAGAAYVPLDVEYPADRLAFMLEDAEIRWVLTDRVGQSRLPARAGTTLLLLDDVLASAPTEFLTALPRCSGEDCAYVIFTSGTTGRPKGVEVRHRGLSNVILSQTKNLRLTPESRVVQFASLSFDASAWEIFSTLVAGATLELGSTTSLSPGAPLHAFLTERGVTHATLPGSVVARFSADVPQLQTLTVAGEACPVELMRKWRGGRRFINAYGPTENSICATTYVCDSTSEQALIGKPIPNVQAYILDAELAPCPIGVPGELYLGGESLARGYLNRPELTAERFPELELPLVGRTRLYRTGDLARWRDDGNIEFLGRTDHQVKIRGHRIEIGEVEACLGAHPSVRECLVVARPDGSGEKRLLGYVVLEAGVREDIPALRAHVLSQLPAYMLPASLIALPAFPLDANGKIDRRSLPAPAATQAAHVEPRTAAELALATVWRDAFGRDELGIDDNFFELGGDSILSIQVVSKIRQLGWALDPNDVFRHQTIRELASVVRAAANGHEEQGAVEGEVPLSPIHRWFFEQTLSRPQHWNQSVIVNVHAAAAPLDAERLQRALGHVVEHHDALRSRFDRRDTGWTHHIAREAAVVLEQWDMSRTAPEHQQQDLSRRLGELQRGHDLARGPVFRAALVTLAGAQRLVLSAHHAVVDGISWQFILEDLETAYRALTSGEAVALPKKTTSIKRWGECLGEYARSAAVEATRQAWLDVSREPVTLLARDTVGQNTAGSLALAVSSLDEAETRAVLQEVPRAYHAQSEDVLLAALAMAFASWRGVSTTAVMIEGHGREEFAADLDASRTVGWFTTLRPALLVATPGDDLGAVLSRTKEHLRRGRLPGLHYGILRYLADEHPLPPLPSVEVSFNFLGKIDHALSRSTLFTNCSEPTGPWRHAADPRPFLLEINTSVADGRLTVEIGFSESVHNAASVQALTEGFAAALRAYAQHGASLEGVSFTPSDFAEAALSQTELDELLAAYG
jgi:amino acid adenylation domain-containing protein/non-ribosomal peptide synthase protein (TIGR01720 family)